MKRKGLLLFFVIAGVNSLVALEKWERILDAHFVIPQVLSTQHYYLQVITRDMISPAPEILAEVAVDADRVISVRDFNRRIDEMYLQKHGWIAWLRVNDTTALYLSDKAILQCRPAPSIVRYLLSKERTLRDKIWVEEKRRLVHIEKHEDNFVRCIIQQEL